MSIGPIDTNPYGDDTTTEVDPVHDATVDQGGGVDTDESTYFGRARRHVDPLGTALMRLGVGRSRELDRHAGYEGLLADPHAANPDVPFRARDLTTGTDARPERWTHDEALQVRELSPTDFDTNQYVLQTAAVSVAPKRPERLTIILENIGSAPLNVGRSQVKARNGGFVIPAGGYVMLKAVGEIWACALDAAPTTLCVLEQWRTDNPGL